MFKTSTTVEAAFEAIAIDDDGRACRDIPESACREEAGNFFTHVGALALSKSADGLIDPKLVLSWLITAVGAPAALVGLLVPIREAGALLPQLLTAGYLRQLPERKWVWAAGAAVQGASALVIALAALLLSGVLAGIVIVLALACLALARSVCSVCYKDVLGKTVDKSRRGKATGLAGTLAASVVIVYALMLSSGGPGRIDLVIGGLVLSGIAWIGAGYLFTRLEEERGSTEGGRAALEEAIASLDYLKTEPQLRRFIIVRGLLTATALAPPFMVAAAAGEGASYGGLGFLVLASASAGLLSSFVWGSLADSSSRMVLIVSAVIAAAVLALTALITLGGGMVGSFLLPLLLFGLMVAYQGVRLGRSTHLVDMADEETRAAFTALSNTVIGVLLLTGGIFSLIAAIFGTGFVLALMAGMCAVAVPFAASLEEVQAEA